MGDSCVRCCSVVSAWSPAAVALYSGPAAMLCCQELQMHKD